MFVKPGENRRAGGELKVRVPRTHELLPSEGREVPKDAFWLRRLRDGDVVLAHPPEKAPEEAPAVQPRG